VAADYAEHRPGYPAAAVDWALERAPGPDVLDLGAGTGKLTTALLERRGLRVVAVEPDPDMLAQLRQRHPHVDAREGAAEAIPLPDASVDAVVAGQAVHWFDLDVALPEIARVLRPGGVFAGLWNGDDVGVEWVAGYQAAAGYRRRVPDVGGERNLPLPAAFGPLEQASFPYPVTTTVDGLIATLSTHSWALISEPAERDAAMARVRGYLATRPEASAGSFELPLVTEVVRALRR
jgi:SAM-dependent methyltransferase